jgi:hypothetical protein
MNRIDRFRRENADAQDRIELAQYQMQFWEEKRRGHQMIHGYLRAAMYETTLRKRRLVSPQEYKRRIRQALYCIQHQKVDPLGKPVLP